MNCMKEQVSDTCSGEPLVLYKYLKEKNQLGLIWQKYKMLYFCRTNYDILHLAKMTQYTLYVGDRFTLLMIYNFRIGNRNIYMKTIHPVLEIMLLFHRYLLCLKYHMSTSTEWEKQNNFWVRVQVLVFNATFNNISVNSWRSVLLVEENRVPWEHHRPAASHWLTLSHNVVSSTPCQEWGSNSR